MPIKDLERRRAYESKWRSKNQAWIKSWKQSNPEKIKEYSDIHYRKNKVSVLSRSKDVYRKNRASVLVRCKAYQAIHREKIKAYVKLWWKSNRPKKHCYAQKRRALEIGSQVGNPKAILEWENKWRSRKEVMCYWCLGGFKPIKCHADHIVALTIGGSHSIDNLCISCQQCNNRKRSKTVKAWSCELSQPPLPL